MKNLEQEIIDEMEKDPDHKKRFNFTLSASTKAALAAWCKAKGYKESPVLDALIRKAIPKKYFVR